MNYDYWNTFYSDDMNTNPSSFAKLCIRYISPHDKLLDVGCGNGRDTLFFIKKVQETISIDSSKKTIDNLTQFIEANIQDIEKLGVWEVDVVYCRFLLHAITEEDEDILLNYAYDILSPGGRIMIETRTEEDANNPKHYDNHDRRYVNINALESKLEGLGYKIIHKEQGTGLSPFKAEDPYLVRFIAEK
jgi:tellurite methyltransferase